MILILDSHLASRVHVGSPVTMHLLRIPEPQPVDDREDKPTFPKKPLNWEEDMQLYSQFLDRKVGAPLYTPSHHGALVCIVANHAVLFRKKDSY